ncbi:82c5e64f-9d13-41e3-acf4-3cc3e056ca3a [Sclerotinia trifoliorum]|uniref:82c5e64f-9d13-41e3-acf4-3cc3e056ca3a n=1 Tax=Sclerotinia trifoliorum TaxID=28548 RepID=A0A8H2ZLW5_9HELO|nr:82c5e64f-9d13-41e3-acf4-3cc3e056ca3a [Sclerotinia trifoliorum]
MSSSRFWTKSPLSDEEINQRRERERRPRRRSREERHGRDVPAEKEREAEYRDYDEWVEVNIPEPGTRHRAASPVSPPASGNSEFFQGADRSKSTKQKKQQQKAEAKERRQKARQEAEDAARKEKKSLDDMDKWEYVILWGNKDRKAHGQAFDDFASSANEFIRDNTKGFPRLKKHGCERQNCVKGNILGVCHHEVELTLRGSGCFDEKMIKKERLRWHPDRWTGKGELQEKSNELFQLIQRIIDGDLNA